MESGKNDTINMKVVSNDKQAENSVLSLNQYNFYPFLEMSILDMQSMQNIDIWSEKPGLDGDSKGGVIDYNKLMSYMSITLDHFDINSFSSNEFKIRNCKMNDFTDRGIKMSEETNLGMFLCPDLKDK